MFEYDVCYDVIMTSFSRKHIFQLTFIFSFDKNSIAFTDGIIDGCIWTIIFTPKMEKLASNPNFRKIL